MKRFFLFIFLIPLNLVFSSEEISIWDGDAPGTEGRPNEEFIANERFKKIHQPSLTVHLPPRELSTGAAVLIMPGGGYGHLAIYKEGHNVSNWLNTLGISAFVLKYRLNREEALQDALQAMRVIRERSAEWGVDPQKLGAMGFSAGGHLLLNTVSNSDEETQPNFLVVMYPAFYDIELNSGAFASKATSGIVFGASDDKTTPPANAITVYQTLLEAGLSAELHLYETGGHGFGLGNGRGPVIDWTDRCEEWFKRKGYLEIQEQ